MTMPSLLSCAPRSAGDTGATACAMVCVYQITLRFCLDRGLIIYLDLAVISESANHLITSGDDFVAILKAAQYFDISSARNAGFYLMELGFFPVDKKDALDLFLTGFLCDGIERRIALLILFPFLFRFQIALLANRESLDGNSYGLLASGGDHLSRAGKSR